MEELKLLRKLGFTEYESRAYLALARLGPSSIKEVVIESKLPRNKVYEVLEKLEQKNKVISLPFSPKKYKITSPESLKEDADDISKSVDSILKIIENPRKEEFKDLFWVIKGKKAIEDKLFEKDKSTEKEILSCNNLSKVLYKNIREMEKMVKRGVKVKMICTFDKNKIGSYKEWLSTGAEIRVFNHKKFGPILPRISIFDNSIARLTLGKPEVKNEEDYITIWTESKAFSQMLRKHFMNMWKDSKPLKLNKYLNTK